MMLPISLLFILTAESQFADAQAVDSENRPIRNLRVEDFILREEGKQLDIRNFQSEKLPVEVILLPDVSRSMEPHVQRIASAAHQALRVLGAQDRIAIMVFDRTTRVLLSFSNSQDAQRELEGWSTRKRSTAAPTSREGCWTSRVTWPATRDAMRGGRS